jgi:hypothetical protein
MRTGNLSTVIYFVAIRQGKTRFQRGYLADPPPAALNAAVDAGRREDQSPFER